MSENFLEKRVSSLEDKVFGDLDKNEQYTKVSYVSVFVVSFFMCTLIKVIRYPPEYY